MSQPYPVPIPIPQPKSRPLPDSRGIPDTLSLFFIEKHIFIGKQHGVLDLLWTIFPLRKHLGGTGYQRDILVIFPYELWLWHKTNIKAKIAVVGHCKLDSECNINWGISFISLRYRDCGILEWDPVPFPIPSRTRIPSRSRFLRDPGWGLGTAHILGKVQGQIKEVCQLIGV